MTDLNPRNYPNPLIGLIGKKRSGKDSFAVTLTEEKSFTRFAFADPMKQALLDINPWVSIVRTDDNSHAVTSVRLASFVGALGWEKAKESPEVRRLLQDFGQSIRRIYPDFWIRATMVPVTEARHSSPIVVTDVRMRNEAESIRDAGGVLIRVERPGLNSNDSHISENDLNEFEADLVVVNDGSLDDLALKARSLFG